MLDPEVAGGLGDESVLDTSVHPPLVHRLHFVVAGWLGDDLIQSFPVYLMSPRLLAALRTAGLTGFSVNPHCRIAFDEQVGEELDNADILTFEWIDVHGTAADDLRITEDLLLEVSDRAWDTLSRFSVNHCEIGSADGGEEF
ncbi:hypothetical protein TPB0596_43840 [Tsukamurella pulmonis]|nr:hypothetical protein AXK56_21470 [Tsukamurella pulmonis]KXP08066.1 hypothetical protein AXK57_16415 [Tsukamurella pulmonis]RDH12058.1 hypothetical protein DVB88_09565 [Tsukamurella pulmonis]BDD84621.1 hypothetical protein TPB0596_43840 [Tsukamurella pulmonis]